MSTGFCGRGGVLMGGDVTYAVDDAIRLLPGDARLPAVLQLIRSSFAYMDARVDPPSSVHRLDLDTLSQHCVDNELWCIGEDPVACVMLSPRPDSLYIGKLAVAASCRRAGLARRLIALAAQRAVERGVQTLELEVRIELLENQAAFSKLGFKVVAHNSHAGYSQPTSVTMQRDLSGGQV